MGLKFFDQKIFMGPNMLGNKKKIPEGEYLKNNYFLDQNIFWSQHFFHFLVQNNFGPKRFGLEIYQSQTLLVHNLFGQENFCLKNVVKKISCKKFGQ